MRRAQAAFEFLMTYGWAFMVVLIAIGALAYFGVLNPINFVPDSCTFQQEILCQDYQVVVDSSDDLVLRLFLQNNLAQTIAVSELNATSTDTLIEVSCGSENIGAGQATEFNCTFPVAANYPAPGDKARFDVEVVYQELGDRFDKVIRGDVSATVQ